MRLVYYGTPELAVPPLLRLVETGRAPLLVVTRRDRPKGRGLLVSPSPVRVAAESLGIPVATPARAGAPDSLEAVLALKPDLLVLTAYGQILPPGLLSIPRLGPLNLHFSLLPRHRGASPIQAAILAGDAETGVTTMWMTEKLDEGPIFASLRTPIEPEEDAGSLESRLAELGARCLVATVERIERGEMVRDIQDSAHATYAPKLTREDARVTLRDDPAAFTRRVRAFAPQPGAFLMLHDGPLQILESAVGEGSSARPGTVLAVDRALGLRIQVGQGSVWLRRVRPGGRKEMSAFDYANGARLKAGQSLRVEEAT